MVKYCTDCGTQLNDSDRFCTSCGKKCEDIITKRSFSGLNDLVSDTAIKRANIPRLNGISEIRENELVIRKTNEIIPIEDIENFSLHQSSQTLWSDIKVDFDYNGLHYRTQQAGSNKGRLQTVEKKINIIEMNKLSKDLKTENNNEKDKIEKLKDLNELLDKGIIDKDEFKKLKDEIIGN